MSEKKFIPEILRLLRKKKNYFTVISFEIDCESVLFFKLWNPHIEMSFDFEIQEKHYEMTPDQVVNEIIDSLEN